MVGFVANSAAFIEERIEEKISVMGRQDTLCAFEYLVQ